MLYTPLITVVLMYLCASSHNEVLLRCNGGLSQLSLRNKRVKVLLAVGSGLASHFVQIVLFALAFYLMQDNAGLGRLGGHFNGLPLSFIYFSAEPYTSLGLGDVFPLGQLRLLAGTEALTGLLMISWTASFTYLQMSRYWPSTAQEK